MRLSIFTLLIILFSLTSCNNTSEKETKLDSTEIKKEPFVFVDDVANFWIAHDKVRAEKDSTKHLAILNKFFFDKGTEGLELMMQARRYKPEEYVGMINNYPLLMKDLRENTGLIKGLSGDIDRGILSLKEIYPDLKPAKVFFTVGVFRSGGTTMEGNVLIGAETAFGDTHANVSELPDSLGYIKKYWATKDTPTKNFALTNVHEYVHTQQNQDVDSNLLGITMLEGIAEFVSSTALGFIDSPSTPIQYGLQNDVAIKTAFEKDMFNMDYGFWIWSQDKNEFDTRDLAYYVGYAAAKKYYEKATDKPAAIKEMIELDHYNAEEIEAFADKTGYFTKPVAEIKAENLKATK